MAKTCAVCGAAVTGGRRVCAKKSCRDQWRRRCLSEDHVCVICGAVFHHNGRGKKPQTCGAKKCQKALKALRNRESMRAKKPRPKKKKAAPRPARVAICVECGAEFVKQFPVQRYCCSSCRKAADRRRSSERRKNEGRRDKLVLDPRICPVCGREYRPLTVTQQTCSTECSKRRMDEERERIQLGKKTDARWQRRAACGQDFTHGLHCGLFAFDDPLCTPLEGLRGLAWE